MEFPIEPQPKTPTQPEVNNEQDESFKSKAAALLNWLWAFLKSPVFLKNTGVLIGFLILSFIVLSFGLKIFTNHNKSIQVENYKGLDIKDAIRKAKNSGFTMVILDSIGVPGETPNQIFQQYPDPLSSVKKGRTVYVSIYGNKMVTKTLPNFLGNDNYDNYARRLSALKFIPLIKEKKFDAKLQENTVLSVWHKGKELIGNDLRKGIKGHQGDTIKCVITTRQSTTVPIPNLVCLDYQAAQFLLSSYQLSIGQIHGEVIDQNTAFIWKQVPAFERGKHIKKGRQIGVYLTDNKPISCD